MTVCYIGLDLDNPRDQVAIGGLQENGTTVLCLTEHSAGWRKFWRLSKKQAKLPNYHLIVVGYASAIFVPWLRLFARKKIIYNALAPLYDGMVVSRGDNQKFSWRAVKYWLIDWLAFHTAHAVLVESHAQKEFVVKTFFLNSNRVFVQFTGANEHDFYFDREIKKLASFTVVFRGKFLPEAGVGVIIEAAKILETKNIKIRIIGRGLQEKQVSNLLTKLRPQNLELITEILPPEILSRKIQECHLTLGQMADHPRLKRTIPHKAFEALAMRLPYLTARQPAVLEVLEEDFTCFCVNPGDAKDLAKKILSLKDDPKQLNASAERGYDLYQRTLTNIAIGKQFLTTCVRVLNP